VIFDVYTAGFPNVWDANLNYILMAYIITPTPIGERSIVMSVSVCVFVCPRSYLQNYTSNSHQSFFTYVTHGRGSVLL